MAFSPQEIRAVAAQLGNAYRRGEVEIMQAVVDANLTDFERARLISQQQKIRAVLDELGEVEDDWSAMHIRALYTESVGDVNEALRLAPPAELSALHETSIAILGENLSLSLDQARYMVGRRVDDVFRQAGLAQLQRSTILGERARDAMKAIVADLQEQGITAFIAQRADGTPVRWNLGTYAEMVARTTSREACDQGLINRMAELGEDLVTISDHAGSCEKCTSAIAQHGYIYSISGSSDEYPSVDQGRDSGLWHPNCVHVKRPSFARDAGDAVTSRQSQAAS
jgi:hypothetical protein